MLDLCVLTLFFIKDQKFYKNPSMAIAFILLFVSSISSILYGNGLSILAHIFSFSVLAIKLHAPRTSTFTSYALGSVKGALGGLHAIIDLDFKKLGNHKKKWHKLSLVLLIPLFLCVVFLSLYANSDSYFAQVFRQIEFPWPQAEDFLVMILFSWLAYPLFFSSGFFDIEKKDQAQSNSLSRKSIWSKLMSKEVEYKSAIYSFGALNTLLFLVLIMELFSLIFGPEVQLNKLASNLHQGVATLVVSLIFAIIIILLFLQGRITLLKKYALLQKMAIVWIILNSCLVILTTEKNLHYISQFGLTYKRIGVFMYLLMSSVGLLLSYLKIKNHNSIFYVYRKFGLAFWALLAMSSIVPWNQIIAEHNIHMNPNKIDIGYLIELGHETYPYLLESKNYSQFKKEYQTRIQENSNYFISQYGRLSWQSYSWSRQVTYNKLMKLVPE